MFPLFALLETDALDMIPTWAWVATIAYYGLVSSFTMVLEGEAKAAGNNDVQTLLDVAATAEAWRRSSKRLARGSRGSLGTRSPSATLPPPPSRSSPTTTRSSGSAGGR